MASKLQPLNDAQKRLLALSKAETTAYEPEKVANVNYLPFQRAGIEYALQSPLRNILLGDEPGLGKTFEALGIAKEFRAKRLLILCPKSAKSHWADKAKLFFPETKILLFDPKNAIGTTYDIVIMTYHWAANAETVKAIIGLGPFDFLIIDEAHNLKNPKAKRTKYTLAKNGLRSCAKRVIAISGTSIVNRPIELFPLVSTLAPECIDNMNYFAYGMRYCEGFKDYFGHWNFRGASHLQELGIKLRSRGFMVRRKKEHVLTELPPKFINVVHVQSDAKGQAKIDRIEEMSAAVMKDAETIPFEEMSAARLELGLDKIDFSVDYICDQLDGGHKKIVVFAHHSEVIEGLKIGIISRGFEAATYLGGDSDKKRDQAVNDFQNNPGTQVFIGSLLAAKEAITLTASSYVIFVEFSWVPGDNEQAMDRAHRIGQKDNVLVEFLVHKDSIDERILQFNLEKSKNLKEFYA